MNKIEFSDTDLITYTCDRCGRTSTPELSGLDPEIPPPGWCIVNRHRSYIYGESGKLLAPYKLCVDCTARLLLWLLNPKDYDEFDKYALSACRTVEHLEMHAAIGDFGRWSEAIEDAKKSDNKGD